MEAEKKSQPDVKKWVDVEEIGQALGMSSHESQFLADLLEERQWVKITATDPPKLRLTAQGREDIAKLHWPKWRQWADKNMTILMWAVALAVSTTISIISLIVSLSKH